MTTHADLRESLGSYLTGALGPTARLEIDDHLQHCDACRDELVELAALPGLLGRLGPGQLGVEPLDSSPFRPTGSDQRGAVSASPPDGLLEGLLGQARRVEEVSRRRLRRLRAATAAIAVAAIVATAFAAAPTLARAPVAGTSYRLRTEAASTHLAGQVTLIRKPWGTEFALSLQGLPAREACEAIVTGLDGQRAAVGNWSATPDHSARVDVASDLPPAQLASLTIETIAGAPLLGATLPQPGS
jgi:hypothetical protein